MVISVIPMVISVFPATLTQTYFHFITILFKEASSPRVSSPLCFGVMKNVGQCGAIFAYFLESGDYYVQETLFS